MPTNSQIDKIRYTLELIQVTRSATLDNHGLPEDVIARLRNAPTELPRFTDRERHAIDLWLNNPGRKAYEAKRQTAINAHPEDADLLTYHEVKKKIAELTDIEPLIYDMCFDSHMALPGPGLMRPNACFAIILIGWTRIRRFRTNNGALFCLAFRFRLVGVRPRVHTICYIVNEL